MAKPTLTQKNVPTLSIGLHRFSRGLYLQVNGPEARSWLYRYMMNGQQRSMGVGPARDVTFAQARKVVDELRVTKVAQKIDPIAEKKNHRHLLRENAAKAVPFRERARQYIEAHEEGWRNRKHREQWRATLQTYAYPHIGDTPAHEVTIAEIVEILRPIWVEKRETARRVRGRIESVLDYAADPDDPLYRNPAALTPQLLKKLPKVPKSKQAAHHPSLPYPELAAFMVALRTREGIAAKALQFAILTAARTSEVIGAQWREIDTATAIWIVPPDRMKGQREHRVPLSPAALEILAEVRKAHNGGVVFPSLPFDNALSNMALLTVLKRMNRREITPHGFRATFDTWASECTEFPKDVVEAALAHVIKDKTQAAYQRGDLLDKRRKLMTAWAEFCVSGIPS